MDKDYINQVKMYVHAEDELKRKLAEIRINKDMRSLQIAEDFQPIIKPLNQSIINNHELIDTLKETLTETAKVKNEEDLSFLQKSLVDKVENKEEIETAERFSTPTNSGKQNETSTPYSFTEYRIGDIALKYLSNNPNKMDNVFGIRTENNCKYIGDSEVKIIKNDIIIKDKKYEGTEGLWELLTTKEPEDYNYTNNDYDNYTNIILNTNAVYQNNDKSTKRIKSSGGYKYKNIIRPILLHMGIIKDKKYGEGLSNISKSTYFKNKTKNNVEYKYWNDIDELKERLNLLIGESEAGNDDPLIHNEIMNIIEELREEGII